MSSLGRLSYSVMVGLAYQSIHSHQVMTNRLVKMAKDSMEGSMLEAKAKEEQAKAAELEQKAVADEMEAETLTTHAKVLKEESWEDMTLSKEDSLKAAEYEAKATQEEVELEAHQASALVEETASEEQTWKADTETAKAATDTEELSSSMEGTAACEWIPFVDVVCDVVGGVAAIALETQATKLTVQAGVDYALAASSKVKEEADLATVKTLEVSVEKDTNMAVQYETKATEEQMKAEEEAAQAKEERATAKAKSKQSQEETLASQETIVESEIEETKSTERITTSIQDGVSAFWHALVTGLLSTASILFFGIRFLSSIIIPSTQTLFITTMSIVTSKNENDNNVTIIARNDNSKVRNLWTALPRREISYFVLHCGIFVTSLAFFDLDRTVSQSNNLRAKGGIILTFASISAMVQMILLHLIPLILHQRYTQKMITDGTTIVLATTTIVFGIIEGCLHYLSLTLLFVMETLILWLISGQSIFLWPKTLFMKPIYLCLLILSATAIHHYIFCHCDKKEQHHLMNNNNIVQKDCIVANEESTHLLPQTTKDETPTYSQTKHDNNSQISTRDFAVKNRDNNSPALDDQTAWYGYFAGTSYLPHPVFPQKRKISSRSSKRKDSIPTLGMDRYISSLLLPFEILVLTCMFVLIQKCVPIVLDLWANIIIAETKQHHILWPIIGWSGIFIILITWCSYKNVNTKSQSNVHLWSGNIGKIPSRVSPTQ